jgi:uncharacterized RDD family membrane protein YckC/Tfp pilus assembly major pilin PilA
MTINCPKCNAENADQSLFCQQCGASMAFRRPAAASAITAASSEASDSPYAAPRASTTAAATHTADIFAGFWLRLVAAIIDGIILNVVIWVVSFTMIAVASAGGNSSVIIAATVATYIFSIVGNWLYFALMESSSKQATVGKMALGLKVVDEQGERIGFGRATGRHFGKLISSLIIGIGFLMAAWTRKRQALHDLMAGSLVVRNSAAPEAIAGAEAPPVTGIAIAGVIAAAFFVIAIPVIGILAAIAIPQYQDYNVKAKISAAIISVEPAKGAVERYYDSNEAAPATLKDAGFVVTPSPTVRNISINAETSAIEIEFAFSPVDGESIYFVPEVGDDKKITWTCSSDIKTKLLPTSCQ